MSHLKTFGLKILREGRRNWGGGGWRGSRPRCPLPGGARGAKVPFQFKGLPWRNSELTEMLVQLFYEFASENVRNAVIELQEQRIHLAENPLTPQPRSQGFHMRTRRDTRKPWSGPVT